LKPGIAAREPRGGIGPRPVDVRGRGDTARTTRSHAVSKPKPNANDLAESIKHRPFVRPGTFEEAFPRVESVRVSAQQVGDGIGNGERETDGRVHIGGSGGLRPFVRCRNPACYGGGFELLNKRFAAAAKAAGYALSLHALRHSCASRLAQRGIPLPTIGAILGHKSWRTTARYAHHVPAGATEAAMKALGTPIPDAKGTERGTEATAKASG
jgi:integrase